MTDRRENPGRATEASEAGESTESTELTEAGDVTGIRVRAARQDEVKAVLAFWSMAAEGESVSDDPVGVHGLIARDPEALLLAELADGTLVGTLIAGFDGWRCHLYRLAVAPEYRRQGVATTLLAAAERRFTALGGRRADAMVLHANERAHQTWRARGYQWQPEWGRWVKHLTN